MPDHQPVYSLFEEAMRLFPFLLFLSLLGPIGCDSDTPMQSREEYDKAIRRVQDSQSQLPGVSTKHALDVVLASLDSEGFAVQPEGWTCTYRDRQYYIWYSLKIDKNPVKFHWIVSGEDSIFPVNELAQTITKKSP